MVSSAIRLGLASAAMWASAAGDRPAVAQAVPVQPDPTVVPVPDIQLPFVLANSPIGANVVDSITITENQALRQAAIGRLTPAQAADLLGKLMINDRTLSPNRLEACSSCHTPQAGFTGGVSFENLSDVAYPGAVFFRGGQRNQQTYAYAPFSPVLHYDAARGDFVGGNFWDARATGLVTGSASGDQALGPPLDPLEMAMPDPACVVYRVATGAYSAFFQQVWGAQAFAITWPGSTDAQCSQPSSAEAANPTLPTFDAATPPTVLALSDADRSLATQTFHQIGLSIAAHEAGPEVSAFTSKFDYSLQGKAYLTAQEKLGYGLFTGKANCSQCHDASGAQPLFTNFGTANVGLPQNPALRFYGLDQPEPTGFVTNPSGAGYVDPGLGGFLASPSDANPDWQALAPSFVGRFMVATVRNAAKHPGGAEFFKAYTHNGTFKTLKDYVHFYNTRDALPRCGPDGLGAAAQPGVTCWPAPEVPQTVNHALTGNLGLSNDEEDAIVAFLGTLSDGYNPNTGR